MDINKKDIVTLESNTNKDNVYNNNENVIDIEPLDWDDI